MLLVETCQDDDPESWVTITYTIFLIRIQKHSSCLKQQIATEHRYIYPAIVNFLSSSLLTSIFHRIGIIFLEFFAFSIKYKF